MHTDHQSITSIKAYPSIGVSVQIFGTTSPASGNYYSVLLDNTQSPIFSAASSFTGNNTLLYVASGLAPNVTHQVTVRNEGGGTLQLQSGGFTIFSSGDPMYAMPFYAIELLSLMSSHAVSDPIHLPPPGLHLHHSRLPPPDQNVISSSA
jgi:hypothetical protein